jgi:hypothetical protein
MTSTAVNEATIACVVVVRKQQLFFEPNPIEHVPHPTQMPHKPTEVHVVNNSVVCRRSCGTTISVCILMPVMSISIVMIASFDVGRRRTSIMTKVLSFRDIDIIGKRSLYQHTEHNQLPT